MPKPKPEHLASPLKEFNIPIVSWQPNDAEFQEFKVNSWVTYGVPANVTIKGSKFLHVQPTMSTMSTCSVICHKDHFYAIMQDEL